MRYRPLSLPLSSRLTCHGDLALGPADRSARPAECHQHGCLGGLFPPPGLLCTDHRVSEQSGWSHAASGVCTRPLRWKVRLDGGLSSLRLRPGQTTMIMSDLVFVALMYVCQNFRAKVKSSMLFLSSISYCCFTTNWPNLRKWNWPLVLSGDANIHHVWTKRHAGREHDLRQAAQRADRSPRRQRGGRGVGVRTLGGRFLRTVGHWGRTPEII